jgi:hypothetical protein
MNPPRNFEGRLIDLSFRTKRSEDPESRDFTATIYRIPACAGMTSRQSEISEYTQAGK